MDSLANKTLVMIVGPAAIGKSSLMNTVTNQDQEFGRVSGFTTRQPRSNDEPGMYRYITDQEASSLIANNDVVQYAVHPTTNAAYGSQVMDYPKTYNMLDTLSNVVDELRALPFKRTVVISLTANADAWQEWFLARYPRASDERTKRLQEAILSIEWSLGQTRDHAWIVNAPEELESTANQLIATVRSGQIVSEPPKEALLLLQRAKSLLS